MVDSATRMSTMAKIPTERTLTLSHLRTHHPSEIARRLALGTTCKGIEQYDALVLRRMRFDESLCDLVKDALQLRLQTRMWKKVELRNCDGDVAASIATCMDIDAIEEIQLVLSRTEIPNDGWLAISEGLQSNSKLKCLRITTALEGRGMSTFARGLCSSTSSLRILDLSYSSFESDEAVEALAFGLRQNTTLEEVHLMGCSLMDQHAAWLSAGIRDHSSLQCWDLNGNKCGPASSFAIADLLSVNSHLQKLDLSFQTSDERLDVRLLVDALRHNTSLKILDLSNCGLDDEDVLLLGTLLCDSPDLSITELFIARNKITDRGISGLAAILPEVKSLRRLSLWGNPFNDLGAQALANGMRDNRRIEELDLFRNFFCSEKILLYTNLNRAGRRLLDSDHRVPLGLWPLVLSRINSQTFQGTSTNTSDLMFHMIRGPALFEAR
jgi:Ran GTPase-activating protein (RanGAP) involved in mRNA processing and transport